MSEETQQNQSSQQPAYKEREKVTNPAELLAESTSRLAKHGGFDLLEVSIDGVQNLNPEKKARKKIFLTESDKKKERENLKKTLLLWHDLISECSSVSEMAEKAQQRSESADKLLKKNLKNAVEETQQLERSYRSMAMFYKNTESDKLKNVTIMNASPDQVKDLDNTRFIDAVSEELKNNYDRLDMRRNYGILVVPGYLGSNKVVEKWAKIAHENKVMMVTDFLHLDGPDDVMEMFEEANLTSGDAYKSNVMMACNYLVGRGKFNEIGEEEDLYIPPSTALAGKVYQTLMSQVTAGKKHGSLNEVDGVRFDLKKSEIANLEKMGLIPMVNEYGKVMAFSAKTLFNGDNLGLQTYSVVRVFDYITKVLMDFLNRRAFENFNANTKKDLQSQIVKFLDSITGPKSLIENFTIKRFEQDPVQKDRIYLDIHLTPYFPAKSFMIKLDGQKGDGPDGPAWKTGYDQQK
jgi:metal-responsive CopG/Arc/MetJ family transcriptional regulator